MPSEKPPRRAQPAAVDRDASAKAVIDDLLRLVAALDRRVPHLERTGEAAIARDADALKKEALRRIAELEQAR